MILIILLFFILCLDYKSQILIIIKNVLMNIPKLIILLNKIVNQVKKKNK